MGILSNCSYYLCGQVESSADPDGWRRELAADIKNIEPTSKIFDPLIKPEWVDPHDKYAYQYKKYVLNPRNGYEKDWGEICFNINKEIRKQSKALASQCNILIARISKEFTWGSIDELEIAIQRRIPIFLWLPDGNISIYGVAGIMSDYSLRDYYIHFRSSTLLKTLSDVNNGESDIIQKDPETWIFKSWPDATESKQNAT